MSMVRAEHGVRDTGHAKSGPLTSDLVRVSAHALFPCPEPRVSCPVPQGAR